jgi:hypothetical protein
MMNELSFAFIVRNLHLGMPANRQDVGLGRTATPM